MEEECATVMAPDLCWWAWLSKYEFCLIQIHKTLLLKAMLKIFRLNRLYQMRCLKR